MELKRFFVYYLDLLIILMILTYVVFSFNNLSMPFFPENNSFLYLGEGENLSYQFFEEMRFSDSRISFSIEDCNSFQRKYFLEALFILENNTILEFYEAKENAELELFCEDRLVRTGGFIIAGEGGPVLVQKSGNFYVIKKAQALLRQESKCSSPNTALHEILHAFGFNHSLNPSNILYKQSYCGQKLSLDILEKINIIYLTPSLIDLKLSNSFLNLDKNYLNLNVTVENIGLKNSGKITFKIILNNKVFRNFELPSLDVGESLEFSIQNLYLNKEIDSLVIEVDSFEDELDFKNNRIILR